MLKELKKIHFIAIGGSIMHNLAIALKHKGLTVSGSDDQLFEPSKSRLEKEGLLPETSGWNAENITDDLDAVILGMHAKADNPELIAAQEKGIRIFSFPEFIYQQSEDKQRIVVGGSHGKTTITSMIMHVLNYYNRSFDYAVGAKLDGFETMVRLSDEAPVIIIEGDEYLTSALDPTPKFLHYNHHLAVISGIAWDHMNVFRTEEEYIRQFEQFINATPKAGSVVYNEEDPVVKRLCEALDHESRDIIMLPYTTEKAQIQENETVISTENGDISVPFFGKHNLSNLGAAKTVCKRLSVTEEEFYKAIQSFKGAGNRLELVAKNNTTCVYKDFAHSPSKLKATCSAVKEQFPKRKLIACLELHTYSSLNKSFIAQYKNTFDAADEAYIYLNPHAFEMKKLPVLNEEDIKSAFGRKDLHVSYDSEQLFRGLAEKDWISTNLLLMSSGNFDNLNIQQLAHDITS